MATTKFELVKQISVGSALYRINYYVVIALAIRCCCFFFVCDWAKKRYASMSGTVFKR